MRGRQSTRARAAARRICAVEAGCSVPLLQLNCCPVEDLNPHFTEVTPSGIWDMPHLSEADKKNMLGLNAARLFNLEVPPEKAG